MPDYHYEDSLKKEYNSIGKKDQVDVILANPPFGASIADGVDTNFPANYRCKESADLFVIMMLQMLKPTGRCAIVLPDGSITGDGVKARIREKLLTDTNLHTIVRLPQSTFFPATVSTNLLFFEKGSPTKEIWYYEHKLPEGQKSYSKTKSIQFAEFSPLIEWWDNREENEQAWKVKVEDLKHWDLDIKNPTIKTNDWGDPTSHYKIFRNSEELFQKILYEVSNELSLNANSVLKGILTESWYLFKNKGVIKVLKQSILQEAIQGKLSSEWRKQNPDVEPAIALLKHIKAEKAKLIKEGKFKKEKPLPPITKEEIPFELPEGWIWCRLGEITNYGFSKKVESNELKEDTWVLDLEDIEKESSRIIQRKTFKERPSLSTKSKFKKGWILYSKLRPYLDKVVVVDQDGVCTTEILPLPVFGEMAPEFMMFGMKGKNFLNYVNSKVRGMKMPRLRTEDGRLALIPVAPLQEQNAIVQKVKALMEKCQSLEAEITQSEEYARLLMQAVLKEAFTTSKPHIKTEEDEAKVLNLAAEVEGVYIKKMGL